MAAAATDRACTSRPTLVRSVNNRGLPQLSDRPSRRPLPGNPRTFVREAPARNHSPTSGHAIPSSVRTLSLPRQTTVTVTPLTRVLMPRTPDGGAGRVISVHMLGPSADPAGYYLTERAGCPTAPSSDPAGYYLEPASVPP